MNENINTNTQIDQVAVDAIQADATLQFLSDEGINSLPEGEVVSVQTADDIGVENTSTVLN